MSTTTAEQPQAAGEAVREPGCHASPLYESGPCDPDTEAAARALRPYIPASTLLALSRISREEGEECDKRLKKQGEIRDRINAIKEQMRKFRIELKQLEKASSAGWGVPLFPRSEAARSEAWRAARQAREAALARGEVPRFESAAEATVRASATQGAA